MEKAKALVQALAGEDFAAATKDFDATMKTVLPPAKMEEIWRQLNNKMGAFREQRGLHSDKVLGRPVVYVTCHFEKADLDARVVFNADQTIGGLQFTPPHAKSQPKTPPYARPDAYKESDVVVECGEYKLPGTLTMPKGAGPFPGVVLVHGSGPNDRDETISANKPLRDLAWGLAGQGIAVIRYDKRTRVYGQQLAKMKDKVTLKEEVVDDALAAAALLRKQPGINPKKVFILGHSLGAVVAPQLGAADAELAGLILMAGNTRPLEDVIVEQMSYILSLKGPIGEEERKQVEKLKQQAARVKDPKLAADTPAEQLPLGLPASYWLDVRAYDQVGTAAKLTQPLLILQGERDYQVTMFDFDGWKKGLSGRKSVQFKSYPDLNHLFMTGAGKAKPAEYDEPGNVAKGVIDDIAAWIKGRPGE
jgi:dienelactone hydrolase